MDIFKELQKAQREAPKIYKKDKKVVDDFIKNMHDDFNGLDKYLRKLSSGVGGTDLSRKLKKDNNWNNFSEKYYLDKGRKSKKNNLQIVVDYLLNDVKKREVFKQFDAPARNFKIDAFIEKRRLPEKDFPSVFYDMLPDKLTINVDSKGYLKGYVDHFLTKTENMRTKTIRMARMIEEWNKIVKQVESDFKSSDQLLKLKALIVMIGYQTGLRPGDEQNKTKVVLEDGTVVEEKTFGVVTLQKEHINFIRKSFAVLKLPGKKNIQNIAEIGDARIVSALKHIAKRLEKDTDFVFQTTKPSKGSPNPKKIMYYDINRYMKNLGVKMNFSDFRKMKANKSFMEGLQKETEKLYAEIREMKKNKVSSMQKSVVDRVYETIMNAFNHASDKLSHVEEHKNVINAYVTPQIVLSYLSSGGIGNTIGECIDLNKRIKVTCNVKAFIDNAIKKKASSIFEFITLPSSSSEVSLGEIEDDLEWLHDAIVIN